MSGLEIVASPLLQVVFETLFQKLGSTGFLNSSKFSREVAMIEADLKMIQGMLADAENKQMEDNVVKEWVDNIRNVVYDLEDILDVINTRQQDRTCSLIKDALFRRKTISEMREVATRLNKSCKWINYSGLQHRIIGESSSEAREQERLQRETMSKVNVSQTFGRDKEKQELMEKVLRSTCESQKLHVISVVGMGGIGKTTLVQLVYNSNEVKAHFNSMVWVYVSPHLQFQRIMEAILRQLGGEVGGMGIQSEEIKNKIKRKITGRKVLIVLDDVWKTYHQWNDMQAVFRKMSQKTMVIITSRNGELASHWCRDGAVVPLEALSNKFCWEIFEQHAFPNKDVEANPNLKSIGWKIVEKCGGLPLAARSLGALLGRKTHEDEWNKVLNSIWKLNENQPDILSILKLSYSDLSSHLKQCFAYCAIFPNGYEFEKRELVLMWMAQNFLGTKEMEDKGYSCFDDLLSRSFFQEYPYDKSKYFMHDLISDLARWAAGKTCFQLEGEEKQAEEALELIRSARYASYVGGGIEDIKILYEATKLRVFIDTDFRTRYWHQSHFKIEASVSKSRHLRVLSLCQITKVPSSIGDLKQLRYLDFSSSWITLIPKSICNLINLQAILLRDCSNLKELPKKLKNLVKLRYLDFSGSKNITEMPGEMGKLTLLRTLSHFLIGNNLSNGIQELKPLNHLRILSISNLQNVMDPLHAKQAMLKNKSKLKTLSMEWDTSGDDSTSNTIVDEVLEQLQPSQNLEELSIKSLPSTKFPTWMSDLIYLRELHIIHCPKLTHILSCRFPKLEDLEVINCKMMEVSILSTSKLQTIKIDGCKKVVCSNMADFRVCNFESLANIEEFDIVKEGSNQEMTNLRATTIKHVGLFNCLQLKELPFRIGELELKRCLLKKLPSELYAMASIFELNIAYCDNLESLAEKLQFPNDSDNSKFTLDMNIAYCGAMRSIPLNMMHGGVFLIKMTLRRCYSLEIFARGVLPVTLKELRIGYCENLQILVEEDVHGNNIVSNPKAVLEILSIGSCNSLKCLASTTRGELPFRIKSLHIEWCENLTSLLQTSLSSGASLSSAFELLEELEISTSPSFTAFLLNEGFQSINNTLRVLKIDYPEKDRCFKPIKEWGLHRLVSLEVLHLHGFEALEEAFSAADEDPVLPSSLKHLNISDFNKLKYLSHSVFQNLTSLNELEIWYCSGLNSLPEGRLPLSLQRLNIRLCPLVKKRCEKNKGEDWPKISHIPYILIDWETVQQL